jgi:hypothetical protein
MTTAIHSRPGADKMTCLRTGRLSLRKGEGRVRVPLDISVVQASNPLTSILSPSPRGEATETD